MSKPDISKVLTGLSPEIAVNVKQHLETILSNENSIKLDQRISELYQYINYPEQIKKAHSFIRSMPESWPTCDKPNSLSINGIGYKVDSKRRCPDDELYQKYPDLRKNIPRGLVLITHNNGKEDSSGNEDSSGKEDSDDIENEGRDCMYSFNKFFGLGNGDNDNDDDNDKSSYTTSMDKSATYFLETSKANGEMAQIYFLVANQREYWVIGSKNRKILVSASSYEDMYSDIEYYTTIKQKDSYALAVIIAKQFYKMLKNMETSKLQWLKRFLRISKFTMNFEIEQINSQHIVPLKTDRLVLIGFTSPIYGQGIHPWVVGSLGKYLEWTSVVENLEIYPVTDIEKLSTSITNRWEDEGAVLYILNQDYQVVQMIKKKTAWYVLLRAIREKIRRHLSDCSVPLAQKEVQKRLYDIRRDFQFDPELVRNFIHLGKAFVAWFFDTFFTLSVEDQIVGRDEFQQHYPIQWLNFLKHYNLPHDNTLVTDPSIIENYPELTDRKIGTLIMFQGVPGLGKNYYGDLLKDRLNGMGITAKVVAQDDFNKESNSGLACYNAVAGLIYGERVDVVILARNNSNKKQYSRYLGFPKCLFICPEEAMTNQACFLNTCINSIIYRQKFSTGMHPTDSLPLEELVSLPFKFMASFNPYKLALRVNFLKPMDHDESDDEGVETEQTHFIETNKVIMEEYRSFFLKKKEKKEDFFTKSDIKIDFRNNLAPYFMNPSPTNGRRPDIEIVNEIIPWIIQTHNGNMPTEHQYIGVLLKEHERISVLQEYYDKFEGKPIGHHVTLMHSNDFWKEVTQEKWANLVKLVNTEVKVILTGYKTAREKLTVMTVRLEPEIIPLSGLPHLTLTLEGKTNAVQSLAVLRDDNIPLIKITEKVILGNVKIL